MAYLIELRRDADTYHMVWADDAEPKGQKNQFDFLSGRAFAIAVDDSITAMGEDDRLKEVFKRARQYVQEQQAKDSTGPNPASDPTTGRGTGTQPGTSGSSAPSR